MKLPFVSRAAHEAVLADRERIRGERDQFAKDRDTQRAVARKASEQYTTLHDTWADTALVNDCLTDANLACARRLTRALRACARYRAAWSSEKRRADRLQRELDDAVGLGARRIEDSSPWQPGSKKKEEAAS